VLGTIASSSFDVLGARHEWAQFGDAGDWDTGTLVPKLQKIATELCSTFGDVPFARYVFLAGFRNANGGLEHLDSTLLSMNRRQRPDDPGTLSFVAHEYAHAFNVKRLRPVELGPFDYEHPPTTPSLWIAEGLTTWFGDLALARAGAITNEQWLALVSGHVRGLQQAPGRKRQTLADASTSVWTSSRSGVGGDPRSTISYYVKGPVVGFVLEARLRAASGGEHGLDEVMRRAYARYSGARGFTPEQFEAIAAEVAGSDQRAFFDLALRSTDELDYAETLQWFGLEFRAVADDAPREQRHALQVRADASDEQRAHLRTLLAPTPAPKQRAQPAAGR
jgi:predicted metalloprotease with PDZ domain